VAFNTFVLHASTDGNIPSRVIFIGFPSGWQLLAAFLAVAAGLLLLVGLPLLLVGFVMWPATVGRGLVIAGGSALGLAGAGIGWAYFLWA
jgi:hypothetical protein